MFVRAAWADSTELFSFFFKQICENVINNGWKVKWIEEQKVPYAYGDGEWVGFDSPDSFYLKVSDYYISAIEHAFHRMMPI